MAVNHRTGHTDALRPFLARFPSGGGQRTIRGESMHRVGSNGRNDAPGEDGRSWIPDDDDTIATGSTKSATKVSATTTATAHATTCGQRIAGTIAAATTAA
jgi:hypothetical protein